MLRLTLSQKNCGGRQRQAQRCARARPRLATMELAACGGAALVVLLARCGEEPASTHAALAATEHGAYVGAAQCASCHPQEHALWEGSHHDLAMQEVSAETVLGDFNDARFTHFETTARFFQRDGSWLVETQGADGALTEFALVHVFGVEPLRADDILGVEEPEVAVVLGLAARRARPHHVVAAHRVARAALHRAAWPSVPAAPAAGPCPRGPPRRSRPSGTPRAARTARTRAGTAAPSAPKTP